MWIFETGKIEWIKKSKSKFKFTLKGKQLDATFSLYKIKDNEWMIQRAESANMVSLKNGIKPMLSDAMKALPKNKKQYIYEIKWDGIRAIFYKNKKETKLISLSLIHI